MFLLNLTERQAHLFSNKDSNKIAHKKLKTFQEET